jgi:hypothetical protein
VNEVDDGAFQVYNIADNQITGSAPLGTVGTEWQLGGFAPSSPTGATGSPDGSTDQLVQAMAGFGGSSGAGESLNTAPLSADTSQQRSTHESGPTMGRGSGDRSCSLTPALEAIVRTLCASDRKMRGAGHSVKKSKSPQKSIERSLASRGRIVHELS